MIAQTPPPGSSRAAAHRSAFIAPFREIFGIDLRTLALFRVGLGGVILASLYVRALDLTAHYTDFGVLPPAPAPDDRHTGVDACRFHAVSQYRPVFRRQYSDESDFHSGVDVGLARTHPRGRQNAQRTFVDVYHGRMGKPDWTKPSYISREYRNARWQKYLTTLEERTYDYVDDPYMNH